MIGIDEIGARRRVYGEEHEQFRTMVRSFLHREVLPQYPEWLETGFPPRSFWKRAGELGLLGMQVPVAYGGGGVAGFKFNAVLTEEIAAAGVSVGGVRAHVDMVLPYLLRYGTEEQKARWLPGAVSGEVVLGIALTEPGAGSDLAGIATSAIRDGEDFILNGSKTFISNGLTGDLYVVAVKTDPAERHSGMSLLLVEADRPGFSRGRNLKKIGLHAQETAELFFSSVRIPAENLLGVAGQAFSYLTSNLPQERLSIALQAQAGAATALQITIEYVKQRKAFGTTISSFQNTKFELATCATEIRAGQALIDEALDEHDRGELSPTDAAMLKLFCTEMQGRVVDRCVQLHGGYGFMEEYQIARSYVDARATRLFGGTTEIMKTIIAKELGL